MQTPATVCKTYYDLQYIYIFTNHYKFEQLSLTKTPIRIYSKIETLFEMLNYSKCIIIQALQYYNYLKISITSKP